MAGRPGRSGARPKPIADHLLNGTFRRDRHGAPASHEVLMAAPAASWTPSADDLARLGDAGRGLVERIVAEYEFDVLEGAIVLEAGFVASALARWRNPPSRSRLPPAARERLLLSLSRHLAALLAQLKLRVSH